uniref:Uncharacterized protein n=1 Tax=Ciona intestinalis TaxID=7719 RepID=H2XS21_CIOIN
YSRNYPRKPLLVFQINKKPTFVKLLYFFKLTFAFPLSSSLPPPLPPPLPPSPPLPPTLSPSVPPPLPPSPPLPPTLFFFSFFLCCSNVNLSNAE